jgi:hypothetical protein
MRVNDLFELPQKLDFVTRLRQAPEAAFKVLAEALRQVRTELLNQTRHFIHDPIQLRNNRGRNFSVAPQCLRPGFRKCNIREL